ncbi:MAG: chromosome partitioning protein ParB, partial [Chloroflexi bacterium]|nr:chromosome partitioning protein ParB [Chloroflexota bacterium]
ELANLESEYKLAEQYLGTEVLTMVVYRKYLERLLENYEVTEYLSQRQPEVLLEFQRIVKTSDTHHG